MDGTAVLWQHCYGTVPWTTLEWCYEMDGCTHWKGFQQEAQDETCDLPWVPDGIAPYERQKTENFGDF